ncbi:MAG: hypothetical protein Alpg2KO_05360 [Alphaproteobacteria bacterium]
MKRHILHTDAGASALTYGLLVGLISITALVAITSTGDSTDQIFTGVSDSLQGAIDSTGAGGGGEAAPSGPGEEEFAFSSHTFTTCGQTNSRSGPAFSACQAEYSGEAWSSDPAFFSEGSFTGYQVWTVPATGQYRITAAGASGGEDEGVIGHGYELTGTFNLTSGDKLTIAVGQTGSGTGGTSSGGGGSFVALGANASTATPLVIGGGGGGYRTGPTNCDEINATSPAFPLGNGTCVSSGYGACNNGASTPGQGGQLCSTGPSNAGCPGGTGAGFEGNGLDGPCLTNTAPLSFRNGLTGGERGTSNSEGGFGGGSSSGNGGCGAGGGYSGGGAHDHNCGGGASYMDGGASNVSEAGVRSGSSPLVGFVTIERL